MVSLKEQRLAALHPNTPQEAQELLTLGLVVKYGMAEIDRLQRLTGDGIEHTYRTHFPMPDDTEWELTVKRRGA